MKKYISILLVLVSVQQLFGGLGGFSYRNISEDPLNNRLYIGINETGKRLFSGNEKIKYDIVNYLIYDINNDSKKYIFPDNNSKAISTILFEIDYDSTENRMLLNGDMYYSDYKSYYPHFVVNNHKLEKRTPNNKILFILKGNINDPREIWTCNKDGSNLIKIVDLHSNDSWHIDLKNEKIRIIKQAGPNTQIMEYDW